MGKLSHRLISQLFTVAARFTNCHSSFYLQHAPEHAHRHENSPLYGLGTETEPWTLDSVTSSAVKGEADTASVVYCAMRWLDRKQDFLHCAIIEC